MKKWKYSLVDEGEKLKGMMDSDEEISEVCKNILEQIKICSGKIFDMLNEDDKPQYGDILEEMMNEDIEILTEEVDEEELVGEINYQLAKFYDICDDCRCWLGI